MPRRLLNSKIWTNEKVGNLPLGGRLLFIALITHADDDGRLKGSPKYLKALCFPYDDLPTSTIQEWLHLLSQQGLILPYAVNGNDYLSLVGWLEHQSIRKDRYSPSSLPLPPGSQVSTNGQPDDNQVSTNGQLKLSKDKLSKDNINKLVLHPRPRPREASPVSFEGWLKKLSETKNPVGVLGDLFKAVVGVEPDHPRLGVLLKRYKGDAGLMAKNLWLAAAYRPAGDIYAYIEKMGAAPEQKQKGAYTGLKEDSDGS